MDAPRPVDVCLVVEGCYPFVAGGVSSWLDWLIRSQPELTFGVVAITADDKPRESKFDMPPNVKFLQTLPLSVSGSTPSLRQPRMDARAMAQDLKALLGRGERQAFERLVEMAETPVTRRFGPFRRQASRPTRADILDSMSGWDVMTDCYRAFTPEASFVDFFWAWRTLLGGFASVLTAPIPEARSYHAISTGYAGLFGAVAARRTGRPFLITEHGIYTNERRIDLIMADWIPDVIEKGLGLPDPRLDVRDFWVETFCAYARVSYDAATKITTLYGENQLFQKELGAVDEKLAVIPNGIDLKRFSGILPDTSRRRPCVALIGRVVPIKDIEAFILATARVRRKHPDVEVLIMGPTSEDAAYFEACKQKVDDLGLRNTIRFTGKVNIVEYFDKIDVMALTSISEAQPLVILEAGAAGIPCVATDVGSCREIIEGAPDGAPNLGRGGRVVPPMAPDAVAEAIHELLRDEDERKRCGEALRRRVETYFTSEVSSQRYADLYDGVLAA